jgi:hypothetical protein
MSVNVVHIDWEKRDWKRIYTPEEQRDTASKVLRLNGIPDYDYKLLAASTKTKPTIKVKRLVSASGSGSGKLKGNCPKTSTSLRYVWQPVISGTYSYM